MTVLRRHHRAVLLLLLLAGVLAVLLASSHLSHTPAILLALVPVFLLEAVLTFCRALTLPIARASLSRQASARPALFQLPPPLPIA
jgi:hypothetical protein